MNVLVMPDNPRADVKSYTDGYVYVWDNDAQCYIGEDGLASSWDGILLREPQGVILHIPEIDVKFGDKILIKSVKIEHAWDYGNALPVTAVWIGNTFITENMMVIDKDEITEWSKIND